MHTCLVFLQPDLIADSYPSLVYDDAHQIVVPLENRSLAQIKALQQNTLTYLIYPAQLATLYHLNVPRLSTKKLNTALPFFLETKIPESLDKLHIAYHYDSMTQSYLIVVIEKSLFQSLFDHLDSQTQDIQIHFDAVFLDASLLRLHEALYQESGQLLVHANDFHGAIPEGFEKLYESCFHELTCFSNQPITAAWATLMPINIIKEPTLAWLASRVDPKICINLCQHDFTRKSHHVMPSFQRWAVYLACVWALVLCLHPCVQLYRLHTMNAALRTQIVTAYKQLFPQAKSVVNPKFQLSQYLKKASIPSPIWQLIDALGLGLMPHPIHLLNLSYQNKKLTLTLQVQDFKQLEAFERQLKKYRLTVTQLHAKQQDKWIQAGLELNL